MDLPAGMRLSFEDNPSREDRNFVDEGLGAHNAQFLADTRYSYFGLFVRDDGGLIRAGLIGYCYAGWLFINLLWVEAGLRRRGIGRSLVALAERHGLEFGCHSAWLDTFSSGPPCVFCGFVGRPSILPNGNGQPNFFGFRQSGARHSERRPWRLAACRFALLEKSGRRSLARALSDQCR